MNKILIGTIATCAIFGQAIAASQISDAGAYKEIKKEKHYYVEVNAGTNAYYMGVFSSFGTTAGAGVNGWGYNVAGGYFFNKLVALEAGFMQNTFHAEYKGEDASNLSNGEIKRNQDLYVAYATAHFNIRITERFSAIAKTGLMIFHGAVDSDDPEINNDPDNKITFAAPFVGLGFGYMMTDNLQITAQYQGAVYGIVGLGLFSAGVTYHF